MGCDLSSNWYLAPVELALFAVPRPKDRQGQVGLLPWYQHLEMAKPSPGFQDGPGTLRANGFCEPDDYCLSPGLVDFAQNLVLDNPGE